MLFMLVFWLMSILAVQEKRHSALYAYKRAYQKLSEH